MLAVISLYGSEFIVSSSAEINAVLTGVQPGDTLTMTNGEWLDEQIVFKANGTAEQPIVLRAGTPGKVVLTGASTLRIGGTYLIVDGLYFRDGYAASGAVIEFRSDAGYSHYCRLTNTAIVNYNPASINTDYKWVSLYGSYNRVDHCFFAGKKHSGTTLVIWFDRIFNPPAHYHQIDHNYFGYRPPLGFNGGETIRIGTSDYSMSDSYSVVEYNYFERCNGETEIISNKSGHNTFRINTFYECDGTLTLRHGNFATVEGNFFIGNHKSGTGGVRIIGEDHTVYNNYFQDLAGTGLRSAISIMNGVPDSPLNRYFQVKRAQVLYNTIVNCNNTIVIGAEADAELSLPPENCIIANNLAKSTVKMIFKEAEPINMFWEANIMDGILGIENPGGILEVDPVIAQGEDGLWRPQTGSPAIDAAADNYPVVSVDMDGQNRSSSKDIGADEASTDPITRRPLTAEDVGPDWEIPGPEPPEIIYVQAGIDSLKTALEKVNDNTIIELITTGGIYENSSVLIVDKKVTIRASTGLVSRPVIRNIDSETPNRVLVQLNEGANLRLIGLELDGMAGSAAPAGDLIATQTGSMASKYTLHVDSCFLHDAEGSFLYGHQGSMADTITLKHSKFYRADSFGIKMADEAAGSGKFNVNQLVIENCTFWKTGTEAIYVYGGDEIPFTPSPVIQINHVTFDNCGNPYAAVINAWECDFTTIKNSILSNSPGEESIRLFGLTASISYCDTFGVGEVSVFRSAKIGAGMIAEDPLYNNSDDGNFALAVNSPVIAKADDGKAMGDLGWAPVTSIFHTLPGASGGKTAAMVLEQNYPNPFNPETVIRWRLAVSGQVDLSVYNLLGKKVATLVSRHMQQGSYALTFNAGELASGVYYYQLTAGNHREVKKMILVR